MIKRFINRLLGRVDASTGAATDKSTQTLSLPKAKKGATGRQVYSGSKIGIDPARLSPNAVKVCDVLQDAGYEAYIVGGGVRDCLLGVEPKDFDIATNATPEQVKAEFRRAMIIGKRFRLVHVTFGREIIETSTFRAMQVNALTDEHGRVLRDNEFGTMQEDATRRDFSVNALYYNPRTDEVVDYHGGVADLQKKLLRMIGDPAARYREDPVRMMRAVRFAAKLGFEIDPPTAQPIAAMADLLSNVPSARLFDETIKLLTSGHALACIQRLRSMDLHRGLLPLLDVVLEQPEGERFVTQALTNTDERIRNDKSISPSFLFATLLWTQVRTRWERALEKGEHIIPALHEAIDHVLAQQGEQLAIQRRYQADMREIWVMQPRFDKRSGQQPYRLLEHLRFRAGYDFMLLRCQTDELDAAFGQWWTDFVDGDATARHDLVQHLKTSDAAGSREVSLSKNRRRKRKPVRQSAQSEQTLDVSLGDSAEGYNPRTEA
jgi:poly(A) polymerase